MELSQGEFSKIFQTGWGSGHLRSAQGVELASAGPIEGVGKRIELAHETTAWMGKRRGAEAGAKVLNFLLEGSIERHDLGGCTHLLSRAEKAIRGAAKRGTGRIACGTGNS